MRDALVAAAFIGAIVAVGGTTAALAGYMAERSCYAQWPDNKPSWSWVTECMIEVNGRRIPASAYRELP